VADQIVEQQRKDLVTALASVEPPPAEDIAARLQEVMEAPAERQRQADAAAVQRQQEAEAAAVYAPPYDGKSWSGGQPVEPFESGPENWNAGPDLSPVAQVLENEDLNLASTNTDPTNWSLRFFVLGMLGAYALARRHFQIVR